MPHPEGAYPGAPGQSRGRPDLAFWFALHTSVRAARMSWLPLCRPRTARPAGLASDATLRDAACPAAPASLSASLERGAGSFQ
eukprot:219999-Chlamydomonas_euryale.AAC.4